MKILGRRWFTEATGTMGVVLVELSPKEQQEFNSDTPQAAFIGLVVVGNSEIRDVDRIITEGARFPVNAAKLLVS